MFDRVAFHIGLRPVALRVAGRHSKAAPSQQTQRFVVQRRCPESGLHPWQQIRAVRVRLEHLGVLLPRSNSMQRYYALCKPLDLTK